MYLTKKSIKKYFLKKHRKQPTASGHRRTGTGCILNLLPEPGRTQSSEKVTGSQEHEKPSGSTQPPPGLCSTARTQRDKPRQESRGWSVRGSALPCRSRCFISSSLVELEKG